MFSILMYTSFNFIASVQLKSKPLLCLCNFVFRFVYYYYFFIECCLQMQASNICRFLHSPTCSSRLGSALCCIFFSTYIFVDIDCPLFVCMERKRIRRSGRETENETKLKNQKSHLSLFSV